MLTDSYIIISKLPGLPFLEQPHFQLKAILGHMFSIPTKYVLNNM